MNHRKALFFLFIHANSFCDVAAWGSNATPRSGIPNIAASGIATRSTFLKGLLVGSVIVPNAAAAFDGGVASSTPIQNEQGIVSAEIKSVNGKPLRIEFQTPWPLLPTASGLEARDLRSSESAFVQVTPEVANWQSPKVFKQLLMDSVLASQGKFGAYGTPVDIKVKPLQDEDRKDTFSVTFTSYTPAMRESERQLWIKTIVADSTLVLLIVGTTKARFPSQEKSFGKILDTFIAVPAPESKLRSR